MISYSVVQQTHEIGVRMALGAQRRDVLHMILREGMLLAITGIAIGIGGALGLTRVLRSMLFEIEPTDPATFVGVAIFLTIAALAACYIPARRAIESGSHGGVAARVIVSRLGLASQFDGFLQLGISSLFQYAAWKSDSVIRLGASSLRELSRKKRPQ